MPYCYIVYLINDSNSKISFFRWNPGNSDEARREMVGKNERRSMNMKTFLDTDK